MNKEVNNEYGCNNYRITSMSWVLRWGKGFVDAIGQVWLEKNFGNPNYSKN
jgi:hypothetical protein